MIGESFNSNCIMKKIFSSILVVAAAAIAFSACTKVENQPQVNDEVKTVAFTASGASAISTKTTFGDREDDGTYPTIWTGNETHVKIAQNYSEGKDAAVTKVSDTEARFSADFTDDGSGSYTFYAISPASAVVSGVNAQYFSWNLEIPTDQTPTATGPDEKAMIMTAASSTMSTFPTSVEFTFDHFTAYAKMSITNLALDAGDEVASVLINASENIAYRYFYYVGGPNAGTVVASSGQKAITVHTTSVSDIWFACAPFAEGTTLDISVTTKNSKLYTKSIVAPAALAVGHVAKFSVNFSGIAPQTDQVYNLVTDLSELTDGAKVVLAAIGSKAFAAGIAVSSDNYVSHVAQEKSDDYSKITNPAPTVDIFTLEAGTVTNTIALKGTNGYLYAKSSGSNYMGVQGSNDANGSWTPTLKDAATGEMLLKANGSNRPYMRYNGSANRFSCYSTEGENVALYKLEGSGDEPLIAPVITLTLTANEYNIKADGTSDDADIFVTTNSTETPAVAIYEDADCTTPFSGEWLSAAYLDANRQVSISAEPNAEDIRVAYIKVYVTDAEQVITVTQLGEQTAPFVTLSIFASTGTLAEDKTSISWTKDDVTVTAYKNTSNTAIRTSDTDHFRVYTNYIFTVASSANTISSVEYTCATAAYATALSNQTFSSGTAAVSGTTVTVTGVDASSLSFTASEQIRISSVKVNY